MKIKVYGKKHMAGTSKKTGNAYDIIFVHTLVEKPRDKVLEGAEAKTLTLGADMINYDAIKVGGTIDVQFDLDGRISSARPE